MADLTLERRAASTLFLRRAFIAIALTEPCQFCGARLAVGAVACFRCGKMVARGGGDGTSVGGPLPTQLGTQAKGQLLEGQWRLVKPIGQGAVGVVWQAQDVGLDRPVAVKLMHERLVGDAVAVARFERESRALAALEHPHVVPILGVGRHGGQPFLVMKLLEGRSLAELIHARGGRLAATDAVPVLSKLCEALDFVHGRQVLHRDLKPSNVFVGDQGQVWLLDLGLAHEAGSELTKTTSDMLGAVAYLPPELLTGRRDADRRADVFSLGCLAFEAFVGHPPFTGEPREVLGHQLQTPPPDANALVASLPAGLGALLQRTMAKLPLERPPTAGDFAAQLQRLCGVAADGTVTRNGVPAAPLKMPVRRVSREVPKVQPAREAATVPSEPSLTVVGDGEESTAPVREALTAPSEPSVGTVTPVVSSEATRIGPAPSRPDHRREGPTGPSQREQRVVLRRLGVALAVLTVAVAAFIGVTARQRPPPPPAAEPIPGELRPITSVAIMPSTADVEHRPEGYAPPELPKPPPLTLVERGKETYQPLDYSRFKEVKARRVDRKRMTGPGPPTIEVRVFSPDRKELKADVLVDGLHRGLSPIKIVTRAGPHLVQISREPYPVTDVELLLGPNGKELLSIELQPPGAEAWAPEAHTPAP